MKKAYPHISCAIEETAKVIKCARSFKAQDCELEVRLGTVVDSSYKSGVSRDLMDTIMTLIQTNNDMVSTDWCEFHDFYYRLPNDKSVRTRVTFDTDDLCVNTHTSEKQKIADAIFTVGTENAAIRVSYSREIGVESESIPTLVNTDSVRIQQRRSFVYDNTWSFDFSLTWQGKNKTEAERKQQEEDPIFEIEIELINKEYLHKHDDEWMAASFLLKALDFIPNGNVTLFKANFRS